MRHARPHYDVLLVGAGPVGLLLGNLLRQAGISTMMVEKRPLRSMQSKASTINPYSLAILRSLGLADEAIRRGKKLSELALFWNDSRLMKVDYRRVPSIYKFILSLSQPAAERMLEERYLASGGEMLRDAEADAVSESEEGVQLSLTDKRALNAHFLIGCDGMRSTVRDLVGIGYEGDDLGIELVLADCQLDPACQPPSERVWYFVREDHFAVVIPLESGLHRIYVKRRPAEAQTPVNASREGFQNLLDTHGLGRLRISQLTWSSKVTLNSRLATSFTTRRVFLCGDAAHVFPPLGGLGMNTGFQDAIGLAWRLSAVLRGASSGDALRAYNEERRSMAEALIQRTAATARLIARQDRDLDGPLKAWLPLMTNRRSVAAALPIAYSALGQTYSALSAAGPDAGKLVPCFEVPDSQRDVISYDYIHPRHFVLFTLPEDLSRARESFGRTNGVRIVRVDRESSSWAHKPHYELVGNLLMRPDGIVCAQSELGDMGTIASVLRSYGLRSS